MRTGLILVALAGCGSGGPHDVGDCGSRWNGLEPASALSGGCERACENPPPNYADTQGPTCTSAANTSTEACVYFTFEGVTGCCLPHVPQPGEVTAFYECDGR